MRPLLGLVMLMTAAPTFAKVVTKALPYSHENVAFEAYLAYDDALTGPRPGVLVVHEWWGLNDFAKERARKLAELGYVALAVDLYGKGIVTTDPEQAGQYAGELRGKPESWRSRAAASFDLLATQPSVDPQRIAAIGFCFGGTTCLQMAYSGLDLAGVVSFHGSPVPPTDDEARKIKARILVLHGAADTLVPDAQMQTFQEALRKAGVDYQIIWYGGAKHSFTNPASTALKMDGVGYDARADQRSWEHMQGFFDEIFKK